MHHHLPLHEMQPQDQSEGGYRIRATKTNFPALKNMSFYKLVLQKQAVREPHWHANADELGCVLHGRLLITIYGNKNLRESFVVGQGDAFFIPSGALHSLENIGTETAEAVLQFSNDEPEDFGLSSAFNMFSHAVLGNTWDVPASHFDKVATFLKNRSLSSWKNQRPLPKRCSTHLLISSPLKQACH